MEFFKVVLNENSNANENQIVKCCLGNVLGNDGEIALYEYDEAVKKAKMFKGVVKLGKKIKHVYIMMNSREGEFSTTVKEVHEINMIMYSNMTINEYADEVARDYYEDGEVELSPSGKEWLHNNGCIATSIMKVEEIDYEDYQVLNKYL